MVAQEDQAELLAEVQSITMEFMAQAMSEMLTTPENELEEKLAPNALKVIEKTFEFGVAACGLDKVREYVAPANQNEDTSAAFASRELPTLAKLYAPK